MTELDLASFVIWSVVTSVIMCATGFSYNAFLKRKKEISDYIGCD